MAPHELTLAFARIPAQRFIYLGSNDPDDGGIETIALNPSDVTIDDYLRLTAAIDRLTIYPASSVVFRVMDDDGEGDTFTMIAWDNGKWYSVPAELLMNHVSNDPRYLKSKFVEPETVRV
ncbi:MAG: hypothetical protein E7576_02980 [Ruminococcaceae bacterium]|nr:hypothetical protein [Oscillospiraceae bacterium]